MPVNLRGLKVMVQFDGYWYLGDVITHIRNDTWLVECEDGMRKTCARRDLFGLDMVPVCYKSDAQIRCERDGVCDGDPRCPDCHPVESAKTLKNDPVER